VWISGCHLTVYLRHIFELIVDGTIPECVQIYHVKKIIQTRNACFEDHFILSTRSSRFVSLNQLDAYSKNCLSNLNLECRPVVQLNGMLSKRKLSVHKLTSDTVTPAEPVEENAPRHFVYYAFTWVCLRMADTQYM